MCGRREVGVYGELSGVGLLLSPAPRDFHAGPCRPKIFDPESKELCFFFPPYSLSSRIFVPQPGIKPVVPAVDVWGLNHWTTREVLNKDFSSSVMTSDLHSKKRHFEKNMEKMLERLCWESSWLWWQLCVEGVVGSDLAKMGGRRERRDGRSGEIFKKVNL